MTNAMPQQNVQRNDVDWESQFSQLLSELTTVQDELLDVLKRKRKSMADGDTTAMTAIQSEEQLLGDRLQACHKQREEVLANAKKSGLPSGSLGDLASVLPSEKRGDVKKQVNSTARRMQLLRNESLTNWVIAQRSLLHVSQLIEIYASGGRTKPTYGNGEVRSTSGGLVDSEA